MTPRSTVSPNPTPRDPAPVPACLPSPPPPPPTAQGYKLRRPLAWGWHALWAFQWGPPCSRWAGCSMAPGRYWRGWGGDSLLVPRRRLRRRTKRNRSLQRRRSNGRGNRERSLCEVDHCSRDLRRLLSGCISSRV